MIIDVEDKNIFITSKETYKEYSVLKIKIERGKVTEYYIHNRAAYCNGYGWWPAKRFGEMYYKNARLYPCCECCRGCVRK